MKRQGGRRELAGTKIGVYVHLAYIYTLPTGGFFRLSARVVRMEQEEEGRHLADALKKKARKEEARRRV